MTPGAGFDGDGVVDGTAWRAFCDRLAGIGDRLLEDDFPASPRDRAEGVRHLANQVVGWLGWAIGYPASHSAFFRQNDLVVRWGGPNVDQVTRRARLDPAGTYRISGHMGACEDFVLTLKDGDMYQERYAIVSEVMASELGIGAGDELSLIVSATEQPGPWIPLPDAATMLNIREYYFDWRPLPPATIVVERLDTQGTAPEAVTPERVAEMLDHAASTIEQSILYWNDWVNARRAELPPNTLGPPTSTAGGSQKIAYGFGFFELAADEALVIETDVPDADFFDFQLYSLAWFESLDFANRTTSLNHHQLRVAADGTLRIVVAARDPGVPNWLDNEGRPKGMLTYRWIRPNTRPAPTARVVALRDLRAQLPADTPAVDAEARRAEIAARQAHIAWRYRV